MLDEGVYFKYLWRLKIGITAEVSFYGKAGYLEKRVSSLTVLRLGNARL